MVCFQIKVSVHGAVPGASRENRPFITAQLAALVGRDCQLIADGFSYFMLLLFSSSILQISC